MPKRYASNIFRSINIPKKGHNYHILIEDILHIALKSCAPSLGALHIIRYIMVHKISAMIIF